MKNNTQYAIKNIKLFETSKISFPVTEKCVESGKKTHF